MSDCVVFSGLLPILTRADTFSYMLLFNHCIQKECLIQPNSKSYLMCIREPSNLRRLSVCRWVSAPPCVFLLVLLRTPVPNPNHNRCVPSHLISAII